MRRLAACCILTASAVALTACGGSGSSTTPTAPAPPPVVVVPPPPPITVLETKAETTEFLIQAGLGPNTSEIDAAVGKNASEWLTAEFAKPETLTLQPMLTRFTDRFETNREHSDLIWQNLLSADDVLRQRMMFALSQILVISDNDFFDQGFSTAYYTDILTKHAFGNYRDILQDVTYSPAMGRYLTYLGNRKGDPATGRMPDENYAREILQLFSIGLVQLNMDGTPKRGFDGQPIESYSNEDVLGLAKVFTGLYAAGSSTRSRDRNADWRYTPLQMFDSQHSTLEKTFLGTTIPPNTLGDTSITQALDTIFDHPNVAPFISRQLIQRFTASSPSPAYVQRVATAFETGTYTSDDNTVFGTGIRGDLKATIAAILLDETLHDGASGATDGKVREPVLKFVHYVRAFNASPRDIATGTNAESRLNDTRDPASRLAQHPLRSPSVFNFYRPGYILPGSESGDAGLSAPELQIVNEASAFGYANFMTYFIMNRNTDTRAGLRLKADFTEEMALADNAADLVQHLNVKLTGGYMSDQTIADMTAAINTLSISADVDLAEIDKRQRVHLATLMAVTSGAYGVLP